MPPDDLKEKEGGSPARTRRTMEEGHRRATGDGKGRPIATSHWEWITALISFMMVLGAMGYLLYDASLMESTPPRIEMGVDSIVRSGNDFLVELQVRNEGQSTAAAVQVEGVLLHDGREVERSQIEIDFVPRQGSRKAGLVFTRDPLRHELVIRAMGYQRP